MLCLALYGVALDVSKEGRAGGDGADGLLWDSGEAMTDFEQLLYAECKADADALYTLIHEATETRGLTKERGRLATACLMVAGGLLRTPDDEITDHTLIGERDGYLCQETAKAFVTNLYALGRLCGALGQQISLKRFEKVDSTGGQK